MKNLCGKNFCRIVLLFVLCLCLVGCGKSDEATKADDLILAIGKVTADSGKAIDDAEFYYSMLTEKQKAEVEHYDYLLQAREEYTEACKVSIPRVSGLTKEDAVNLLEDLGLRVTPTERHSERPKGTVLECTPKVGTKVDVNSQVTLVVSKGPEKIVAESSYMNWTYIASGKDVWEFYNPYIEDETLYIQCHDVIFAATMEWRDRYNKGYGAGTASINDTFDKTIPVKVHYEDAVTNAYEPQDFLIEVPLSDLNIETPTDMYFKVGIKAGGREKDLTFNIAMTW